MVSFKDPSFQERVASASKAKQKALDHLKTRPPVDEAVMASRRQERENRDRALAEERAVKAQEKASAKAAKLAAAEATAALKAARLKPPSPEEMKAARDARYAARKARK